MSHGVDDQGMSNNVVQLECARFEEGLASETLDSDLVAHRRECPRCDDLAHAHQNLIAALKDATGPEPLPEGFADEVMARADVLAGRILLDEPPVAAETARASGPGAGLLWGGLAAAALLCAFWAGTHLERNRQGPAPVRMDAATAPSHTAGQVATARPAAADQLTTPSDPTHVVGAGASVSMQGTPTPQAVTPSTRPEPIHDVAGEIRDLLQAEIGRNDGCPVHSNEPVTVTMTIDRTGTLTDRQLLSMAADRDAHACVGYALDALPLPPLAGDVTVTFTIDW